MHSVGGRFVMVYNGEVYNFAELRRNLQSSGHQFRGTGDSEVILAAIAKWGIREAVSKFIGMFAIALWDTETETLTLVRDRLGVKPLYYGWDGKTFWFGSELKALRAYSHWNPRISQSALADFLRFSYVADSLSIYEGISQLRPGRLLEIKRGSEPRIETYWALSREVYHRNQSESEAEEHLEALMADAFNLRMVSDVPVGVFLSGGVDSSVVTALLKRDGPPIRTFTIGFDDTQFNEAPYAEAVARHLGTLHTTQIVSERDAIGVLSGWGDLFDEPLGDASGIPTLLVARLAASHVKVVLSADGGDELFAGYNSYSAVANRLRAQGHHSAVERVARGVASAVPWERLDALLASRPSLANPETSRGRAFALRLRYLRETFALNTPGAQFEHVLTSAYWHNGDLATLIAADLPNLRRHCDEYVGDIDERMCRWDIDYYLPGDVLAKVDRTTMALGIEGREPMLDHRLAEFAFGLPYHLKRGELGTKHLLRRVLYKHVPRALIERPKAGFTPPIGRWMSGALKPLLAQHLDPLHLKSQGLFDPTMVRTVLKRFDAGDPYSVQRVWLLLAFQLWYARWMTGSSVDSRANNTDIREREHA